MRTAEVHVNFKCVKGGESLGNEEGSEETSEEDR
jgi:hypothetical protein